MTPLAVSTVRILAIFGCESGAMRPVADVVMRTGDFRNDVTTDCRHVCTAIDLFWSVSLHICLSFVRLRSPNNPLTLTWMLPGRRATRVGRLVWNRYVRFVARARVLRR